MSIDVVDMLEKTGVRNIYPSKTEINFSCPFPGHKHGDTNPSAYMNAETTAWICHGCKRRGNAISFVAEYHGVSYLMASRWLRQGYESFQEPEGGSMEKELEQLLQAEEKERDIDPPILNTKLLERFYVDWLHQANTKEPSPYATYMFDRGFAPITCVDFGLGFDALSNRITIPVWDHNDDLIGFKGRSIINAKPKYLVLGGKKYGFDMYPTSKVLFGYADCIYNNGGLILTEGELNTIALCQKGHSDAVGISGSWLSSFQADLLLKHCSRVTLFFDSDKAGAEGALHAVSLLERHTSVYLVPDHEGDPASMPKEQIDELISAAQPAIFATLSS